MKLIMLNIVLDFKNNKIKNNKKLIRKRRKKKLLNIIKDYIFKTVDNFLLILKSKKNFNSVAFK